MILDFHHCESEATMWDLSLRPGGAPTSFKRFCTCCANTIIACATFTLICARWMKPHRSSQPPAFLSALCLPITYCRLALSTRELFTLQAPVVQRRTTCLLLYYPTSYFLLSFQTIILKLQPSSLTTGIRAPLPALPIMSCLIFSGQVTSP